MCPAAARVGGDAELAVARIGGVAEPVAAGVRGDTEPAVWAGTWAAGGGRVPLSGQWSGQRRCAGGSVHGGGWVAVAVGGRSGRWVERGSMHE
jgi:hypothetical protein